MSGIILEKYNGNLSKSNNFIYNTHNNIKEQKTEQEIYNQFCN